MLHAELLRERGILLISPEGALTSADFRRVGEAVDPYIESQGHLNGLMIHAEAFPGWADFGSLVTHVRFVKDHHRKIKRVAVVSDSAVLKILPAIASHFATAEIRHFAFQDKDRALAWLETGA